MGITSWPRPFLSVIGTCPNSRLISSIRLAWQAASASIVAKQQESIWGDGFLVQMSRDLQDEFPDMKGFSLRHPKYMRQWYQFWSAEVAIGQQLVAQIPWGHHLVIISTDVALRQKAPNATYEG